AQGARRRAQPGEGRQMKRAAMVCVLLGAAAMPSTGRADKMVWRMATAAPDSTNWARELRAFARDVEAGTEGQVAIKWYFGGIAGDEGEVMQRIGKAQLDGMAAATMG